MKIKEFKDALTEIVKEVMSEATQKTTIDYKDPNVPDKILDLDPNDTETIDKIKTDPTITSATSGTKKLKEMSRKPISYDLAPDWEEKLKGIRPDWYNSDKRRKWIDGMINYIKTNGPSDITSIAHKQFNVPQPRIADYGRELIRAGVFVPPGSVIPQFLRKAGEDDDEIDPPKKLSQWTDPADMFVGPGFSDDFDNDVLTDEEEEEDTPSAAELEKADNPEITSMTDDDFDAFMKYTDLKQKLANVKEAILKNKRFDPEDPSKTPDVSNLLNLKNKYTQQIKDLMASNKYIKDRAAKEVELNEERKRLQKLANIKK